MKSIKEMAEEFAIDPYYNIDKEKKEEIAECFTAGANYVLETIEKALDETTYKKGYLAAKKVVEQLKK